MHSVILDHYTQSPFDHSFHQRKTPRPHHRSRTKAAGNTTPKDALPHEPVQSSLPGQSLLTWSPTHILMTSSLLKWTPYLNTIITNPTAKYSLDLQLSTTKADSEFGDVVTPLPKEAEHAVPPFVPGLENDSTLSENSIGQPAASKDVTPPAGIKDDTPTAPPNHENPPVSPNEPPSTTTSLQEPPPQPSKCNRSSTASTNAILQENRTNENPASSPSNSRPPSLSNQSTHRTPSPSPSTSSNSPHHNRHQHHHHRDHDNNNHHHNHHRLSTTTTSSTTTNPRTSRPTSSRRSSTTRRTDSFLLSRHPSRPIDISTIIHRTLSQHHQEQQQQQQQQQNATTQTIPPSPPPPPPPQNHHDHPIDWTSPASRAAQYAAIDRRKKGLRGLLRKVKRRLRIDRDVVFFSEEGRGGAGAGEGGSVRRYRI